MQGLELDDVRETSEQAPPEKRPSKRQSQLTRMESFDQRTELGSEEREKGLGHSLRENI